MTRFEFVMREGEVVVTLVFTLGRREGDGNLVLQRMSALSAEPGVVAVRMSTIGAEHREPFPRSSFELTVVVGTNPRPRCGLEAIVRGGKGQ